MAFNPLQMFGLQISKLDAAEDRSAALAPPSNDDGAQIVSGNSAAYYGVFLDTNNAVKSETEAIQTYRDLANYPEIDIALQDIVNEAIPHEDDSPQLQIVYSGDLESNPEFTSIITQEFQEISRILKYQDKSSDIFKQFYVDGKLHYQIIVDKANLQNGITDLVNIDPTKIKKVREVIKDKTQSGAEIIVGTNDYYVYNESGFSTQQTGGYVQPAVSGLKISEDAIVSITSGILDSTGNVNLGFLHKAIRPVNMLRMLEDAYVVYAIARAPERRIFYVDVGTLPKQKAEQYMKEIMNQYRNKLVYDAKTGTVRDDKKYMSMLEDFWIPRRDNKNTEISTLQGAGSLGTVDQINYYKGNLYQSLNVPLGRIQQDQGFSIGRSVEVSRDEVKFQKFIDKLRRKFSKLFYDLLKTQLILKGIVNNLEWEQIKPSIHFRYQRDNFFAELKNLEVLQTRLQVLPQVDQYLGKYFSKVWVQKNILKMTDEDIERMNEEINNEMGDPSAMPSAMSQMMMGMGGDPNAYMQGNAQNNPQGNDAIGNSEDNQDQGN